MKKTNIYLFLFLLLGIFGTLSSCSKDDDEIPVGKPVINLSEVGLENSRTAVAGSDLHLEGDILAEGLIAKIDIEIHQEDGGEYKIEKSWTEGKYIGVKNTTFHEHLDIPADAPAGEYHLHFAVTDQLGNTATVESELTIESADVPVAYQLQFTESAGYAHGNHFHDLADKEGAETITVSFDAQGSAIIGGHLHLDPHGIYKVELKQFDDAGNEVQGKYIESEDVAKYYKAFLIGGDFILNSTTEDESGAIFQPRETKYGDGTDVTGASGTGTTGTIFYFTVGHANEGEKDVTYVLRKFSSASIKPTITREQWNLTDYATKFAGEDVIKLSFEIHAEEGHDH